MSDYAALGRTVVKCSCPASKCFLYLFAFDHYGIAVMLFALPCWKTQPHLISSFLDFPAWTFNPATFCSAAVQDSNQVMFVVELGNGVSRICAFNLADNWNGTEKKKSFIWFPVRKPGWMITSVCLFIDKKRWFHHHFPECFHSLGALPAGLSQACVVEQCMDMKNWFVSFASNCFRLRLVYIVRPKRKDYSTLWKFHILLL